MSERLRLRALLGSFYYVIAFLARLPFAMMVIGVLTAVTIIHGSVAFAAMNSACVGVGAMLWAPVFGWLAQRLGQRVVILGGCVLHTVACWGFLSALDAEGEQVVLCAAFFLGASAPQLSALSRVRLNQVIERSGAGVAAQRALARGLSLESTLDEVSFVFGPFFVGVCALTLGATSSLVLAVLCLDIFGLIFAFHPTASVHKNTTPEHQKSLTFTSPFLAQSPRAQAARPLLLIGIILCIGALFGSSLTSLTALLNTIDFADSAGLWYALLGSTSALLAFLCHRFPDSFSQPVRLLSFSALTACASLFLWMLRSENFLPTVLALALLLMGAGIGPLLVTVFHLASETKPAHRLAPLMSTLSAGILLGQSLSAAYTGFFAEKSGYQAALQIPFFAAFACLILAMFSVFLFRTLPACEKAREHRVGV